MAVGQPTEDTPDTYSLVETTEKVVDAHVVDENLLASQRSIDLKLTNVSLRKANMTLRNNVHNEDDPMVILKWHLGI